VFANVYFVHRDDVFDLARQLRRDRERVFEENLFEVFQKQGLLIDGGILLGWPRVVH